MSIVSFNFTKIDVERKTSAQKRVQVRNDVDIESVEDANMNMGTSDNTALRFTFTFHSEFEPGVGHIKLGGETIVLFPKKEAETIVGDWKEKKRVPKEQALKVLNAALSRAQVLSLILAREVNLPTPVRLPKVIAKDAVKPAAKKE